MNEASVQWITAGAFAASTGSGHRLVIDSVSQQAEQSAGPSPMELLLVGMAGCTAVDVTSILQKQRQPLEGLEVRVRGQRAADPPRVYTHITVEYVVRGAVDEAKLRQAIELSETKYCSASAMLGQTARIESSYRIEEP